MNKISQAGGVTLESAIKTLQDVLRQTDSNIRYHQVENLRSQVSSPQISEKLGEILGALKVPDNLGTVDPSSGKPYPKTDSKIKELIGQIQSMENSSKVSQNSFNLKLAQNPPHKKKRGNPFRVLMGKVGKLLDHGLEKREIVRYLMKEKIWNEETVGKAVGIVKEYNKKKHHKHKKKAQTLPNNDLENTRMQIDYSKRSNAELITSICWLNSLDKIDPQKTSFAKEVADRSGVKSMIREIRAELVKRGMSEDNLNSIMK